MLPFLFLSTNLLTSSLVVWSFIYRHWAGILARTLEERGPLNVSSAQSYLMVPAVFEFTAPSSAGCHGDTLAVSHSDPSISRILDNETAFMKSLRNSFTVTMTSMPLSPEHYRNGGP